MLCWKQALSIKVFLIFWISYSFKSFHSSFVFSKWSKSIYINPVCLKYISWMIVSPAGKCLFTFSFISYISFILYSFYSYYGFNPSLLNKTLAFGFLINPEFSVSHTTQFYQIVIIPLLAFETWRVLLLVFFLHFNWYGNIVWI